VSLFRVRSYLLIAYDWSLKVDDGNHKHGMAGDLKSHKTTRSLNPNESRYVCDLTDSEVPQRHILT